MLGAGAVYENNRGMFPARGRTDEHSGELNAAVREADVFALFDVNAPCGTRSGSVTVPRKRSDLAGDVALKLDSRLDGRRHRHARSGEEPVAVGRIQRSNFSGFIKRDELTRV